MKLEIIAKRISDKTNCPVLYKIILGETDRSALPDKCLIWTGKRRHQKPIIKKHRDWNMLPFMAPSIQPPRAIMRHNKKDVYVQRFLFEIIDKPSGEFVTTNLCGTEFCVNPNHWLVSAAPGATLTTECENVENTHPIAPRDQDNITLELELWPEDEVERMIDYYLCDNTGTIDPNHDLLMDIPEYQLKSVAEKMGQGHRFASRSAT